MRVTVNLQIKKSKARSDNKCPVYARCKVKDIPIEQVNYEVLNLFDSFLKSNYNISENTAWGYHRHLKKVLSDAVAMNLLNKNPYSLYHSPAVAEDLP